MISIQELQLNIVRAYISWVRELYPNEEDGADRLILVLRIYEWHLRRYAQRKPATPDQIATLKHGIRQAEILLLDIFENEPAMMAGWYLGCIEKNEAQRLANLLSQLSLELTKEVIANEALYPALKPMFDRERAEYRRMKAEAEGATRID